MWPKRRLVISLALLLGLSPETARGVVASCRDVPGRCLNSPRCDPPPPVVPPPLPPLLPLKKILSPCNPPGLPGVCRAVRGPGGLVCNAAATECCCQCELLPSATPTPTPTPRITVRVERTRKPTKTARPTRAPLVISPRTRLPTKTTRPTRTPLDRVKPTRVPTAVRRPTRTPLDISQRTRLPAQTPRPTRTPLEHVKSTRVPTPTPRPTRTPQELRGGSPVPTKTARPTRTPIAIGDRGRLPTKTPRPTRTPIDHEKAERIPTKTTRPTRTPIELTGRTPLPTKTARPTRTPKIVQKPHAEESPSPPPTATPTPKPPGAVKVTIVAGPRDTARGCTVIYIMSVRGGVAPYAIVWEDSLTGRRSVSPGDAGAGGVTHTVRRATQSGAVVVRVTDVAHRGATARLDVTVHDKIEFSSPTPGVPPKAIGDFRPAGDQVSARPEDPPQTVTFSQSLELRVEELATTAVSAGVSIGVPELIELNTEISFERTRTFARGEVRGIERQFELRPGQCKQLWAAPVFTVLKGTWERFDCTGFVGRGTWEHLDFQGWRGEIRDCLPARPVQGR